MTTAVNKIWLSTGAIALAAAVVLTPLVAQADPANPTNPGIGSSAGAPTTKKGNSNRGSARPAPVAPGGVAPAAPGDVPPATPGDVAPATPGDVAPTASGGGKAATSGRAGRTAGRTEAAATGANPLFQNSLWWFGTPNPTPPPASYTRTFEPLAGLPGFSQPFFGWYKNLNFEACILGVGNTTVTSVGPYGTSTSSVSTNG